MIKKTLGIGILVIGGIALIVTSETGRKIVPFNLPESISQTTLNVSAIILIIIGLLLLATGKGKSKKAEEVPVYEGNRIVAYRRV